MAVDEGRAEEDFVRAKRLEHDEQVGASVIARALFMLRSDDARAMTDAPASSPGSPAKRQLGSRVEEATMLEANGLLSRGFAAAVLRFTGRGVADCRCGGHASGS